MPSRFRLVLTAAGASAVLALTVVACPAASAAARPPTVATLSVRSGPTAGGTRVTLTGTGFGHVKSVSFGRAAGRSLKVESATKLVVTSPASAAGVDNVRVTTSAGASKIVMADRFTFVAPPVVSAVSPASGSTAGGLTVTVTGSGFTGISSASFGGTAGSTLKVKSSTSLSVRSPKHSAGQVGIRLVGTYGTSPATARDHFSYVTPAPADAWSSTALTYPNGSGASSSASIAGVSCPVTTSCVAVGQAMDSASSTTSPLVETLAAGRWTGTVLPAAGTDTAGYLSAVSCPTSTTCVAVGRGFPSVGKADMIVETLAAGKWRASHVTALSDGSLPTLSSIWCESTTVCVAAGSKSGATDDSPLIETLGGSTWTATTPPIAQGLPSGDLSGVSCSAPSTCTAVGSAIGPSGQVPMVETWDGTSWTASTPPVADGAVGGSLTAVSCPAAGACTAVGGDNTGNPFAIQQSLGSWMASKVAVASGHSDGTLHSVSCSSATSCTAAGGDTVPAGGGSTTDLPLTETLAAGSWTPHNPPVPQAASGFLNGVSCTGTTSCTSVGNRGTTGLIFATTRA